MMYYKINLVRPFKNFALSKNLDALSRMKCSPITASWFHLVTVPDLPNIDLLTKLECIGSHVKFAIFCPVISTKC